MAKLGSPADRPNRVQLSVADFTGILERAAAREKALRAACAAALADFEALDRHMEPPAGWTWAAPETMAKLRAVLAAKGGEAP